MTLGEALEARALAVTSSTPLWRTNPVSVILRQLALTLDEIATVRAHHRAMLRELLRAECVVDTEMMQPYPQPGERARLQGRLFTIETERRRLAHATSEQLRILHQQLLALLNKYLDLEGEDEH
jgi:hypothetical protein